MLYFSLLWVIGHRSSVIGHRSSVIVLVVIDSRTAHSLTHSLTHSLFDCLRLGEKVGTMAMAMRMTIDQKLQFLHASFVELDPETLFMVLQVHSLTHSLTDTHT